MMKLISPINFTQLSESAFDFAHRSRKWTFNDPDFEGIFIQEYWTQDLIRNGEDSVTFYKAKLASFEDIKDFISAVTIISFEDCFSIEEHRSEFAKLSFEPVSIEDFNDRWESYASLVAEQSIVSPGAIVSAYSTSNDWNYITIFAENSEGYHALIWETTA